MKLKEQSTEDKILEAANFIFLRDGFAAARMQAIADQAGINKALLHYYFKSKNQLFGSVFRSKIEKLMPKLQMIVSEDIDFREIVQKMVDAYFEVLTANPYLPGMVISTLSHHPEMIEMVPKNVPSFIMAKYIETQKNGKIGSMSVLHFFFSFFSLCLGPFAFRPMLQHMSGIENETYEMIINERKQVIKDILIDQLNRK